MRYGCYSMWTLGWLPFSTLREAAVQQKKTHLVCQAWQRRRARRDSELDITNTWIVEFLSKLNQTCLNLSKIVQNFPKFSKIFQTCKAWRRRRARRDSELDTTNNCDVSFSAFRWGQWSSRIRNLLSFCEKLSEFSLAALKLLAMLKRAVN